jgi:hypothetical protein
MKAQSPDGYWRILCNDCERVNLFAKKPKPFPYGPYCQFCGATPGDMVFAWPEIAEAHGYPILADHGDFYLLNPGTPTRKGDLG